MAWSSRESHIIRHAKCLIDHLSSLHAGIRARGAKPVNVVLHDIEAARCNEASEQMVIEWERGHFVDIGLEVLGEPDVLGDDLGSCLDVGSGSFDGIGDSPASRAASS